MKTFTRISLFAFTTLVSSCSYPTPAATKYKQNLSHDSDNTAEVSQQPVTPAVSPSVGPNPGVQPQSSPGGSTMSPATPMQPSANPMQAPAAAPTQTPASASASTPAPSIQVPAPAAMPAPSAMPAPAMMPAPVPMPAPMQAPAMKGDVAKGKTIVSGTCEAICHKMGGPAGMAKLNKGKVGELDEAQKNASLKNFHSSIKKYWEGQDRMDLEAYLNTVN